MHGSTWPWGGGPACRVFPRTIHFTLIWLGAPFFWLFDFLSIWTQFPLGIPAIPRSPSMQPLSVDRDELTHDLSVLSSFSLADDRRDVTPRASELTISSIGVTTAFRWYPRQPVRFFFSLQVEKQRLKFAKCAHFDYNWCLCTTRPKSL
jgi:hypothetical protein